MIRPRAQPRGGVDEVSPCYSPARMFRGSSIGRQRARSAIRTTGLAALVSLSLPACADDEDRTGDGPSSGGASGLAIPRDGASPEDPAAARSARLETFAVAPSWAELRAFAAQPHATARADLGPHHLHYRAEMSTGPKGLETSAEPLPPVEVDAPVHERFFVVDELELRWASAPGEGPRFHLAQFAHDQLATPGGKPGKDGDTTETRRRELIILDEQRWAVRDHWPWTTGPVESDLWQLWLDDAQHGALDVLELAGPVSDIDAVTAAEHRGRPALRVRLRSSDQTHPERVVDGLDPWRGRAAMELVSGEILLDRATGLWLSATIELRWTFDDRAHRPVAGHVRFDGAVETLETPPTIAPPEDAQPVPERDRPELLRQRLLGGLAGP